MTRGLEVEAVVDRLSELLHHAIGLRAVPGLRGRLRRSISEEAARRGQGPADYVDGLLAGGEALQDLFSRVTVQETAFFRHPEHFDLLVHDVLPMLGRPITIWSAGCANGQEAFSLAMLLDEQGIDGRIIATDLSVAAVHRTSAACYSARELTGLSPERITRHLTQNGDGWLVNSNLRDRVQVMRHNLLDAIPVGIRGCQVVFCRNVLIYFSPEHARAFLDRVADDLPTTSVVLGAAETMWQLSDRFETVRSGDTFSYRRRPDASTSRTVSGAELAGSTNRQARRPARPAPPRKSPVVSRSASPATTEKIDLDPAAALARTGQAASAAGDSAAAVIAFRKCVYLAPHDPVAHLHLGLALETSGDHASAQRAYAAARRALTYSAAASADHVTEGYTTAELVRFLNSKYQAGTS